MIEYPSIIASSKAPTKNCIAFDKLDGSSVRSKYTQKKGFCLFGSRTQLIDDTHPHLGKAIPYFKQYYEKPLTDIIKKEWPNEREVIVFGEFYGEKSFAGMHDVDDPTLKFVLFDILVGHKNRKFVLPQHFLKLCGDKVEIPRVIYEGNLTSQFIQDVKDEKYDVFEGVICKGTERTGDARWGVWMAKIKTKKYIDLLFNKLGEDGVKKFGE